MTPKSLPQRLQATPRNMPLPMHERSRLHRILFLTTAALFCCFLSACQTMQKKPDGRDARQIYDMEADGSNLLTEALTSAQTSNKRVLLSLGANWCSDSQKTYDVLQTNPVLRSLIDEHYVLTLIDANNRVGHQRNQNLIDRYQVDIGHGIPVLLVLDPNGNLLTPNQDERPIDSDHEHPEKLITYLAQNARK